MLNLEKVQQELRKWQFPYRQNVVPGHSVYRAKGFVPAGPLTTVISEKDRSFLLGFNEKGVHIFTADGTWNLLDCTFFPWKDIQTFRIKQGLLLENTLHIAAEQTSLSLKVNRVVAKNPWVRENIQHLEEFDYYKR